MSHAQDDVAAPDPSSETESAGQAQTRPGPWYRAGLRFNCTQCGDCCRTHGEYSFIYVMEAEVVAIAKHLGLSTEEFRSSHCREEDGFTHINAPGPSCPFLDTSQRCSIYEVRPVQCRTWPFWAENLKRATWEGPVKEICPGTNAKEGKLYSAAEVEELALQTEEWYEAETPEFDIDEELDS